MKTDAAGPRSGGPLHTTTAPDAAPDAADVAARYALGSGGAAAIDGPVWAEAAVPDPGGLRPGTLLLDAAPSRAAVAAALGGDARMVVERDGDGGADGDWWRVPMVARGLFLSLTTGTAFGLSAAPLVCEALVARGGLAAARRPAAELCLHEAIANALVHGNLGIASSAKNHPDGYRVFSRLVDERLGDPVRRGLRLDIYARWGAGGLVVAVGDQGDGFDAEALPAVSEITARSGRGFLFMRELADAVSVTDGGRCTVLLFAP